MDGVGLIPNLSEALAVMLPWRRHANVLLRDEILYHAKVHPEQYTNTLDKNQIEQLNNSIHNICSTSVDVLADPDRFPEDWLFKHRWGKGKKNQPSVLPNGERITFLTVGGRTSAVVPSVQKKTGEVAEDVGSEDANDTAPKRKRTTARKKEAGSDAEDEDAPAKKAASKKQKGVNGKEEGKKKEPPSGTRRSARTRK